MRKGKEIDFLVLLRAKGGGSGTAERILEEDIKNGLACLVTSASGDPASFPDGAANAPVADLKVGIEPVQDLHGYDHPWAGGSGKNLLNNTLSSTTTDGITWTVNADGTVTANGTATANSQFPIDFSGLSGDHYFSGCPAGGGDGRFDVYAWDMTVNARFKKWDRSSEAESDFGPYASKEIYVPQGHSGRIVLRVVKDYTANNLIYKPMLRQASETDPAFEPYANVCPISGWTGTALSHSGADTSDPETLSVSWQSQAGTVYGGTLDVTTGVLTVTHGIVNLGQIGWIASNTSTTGVYRMRSSSVLSGAKKSASAGAVANILCSCYKTVSDIATILMQTGIAVDEDGYIRVYDPVYNGSDSVNGFVSYLSSVNAQLVYELASATAYQLTPTAVTSLLGDNNIWADCGPVTVEYRADLEKYIEKRIGGGGA